MNRQFIIHKTKQPVLISINDTDASNENILFEWLNAYEYHRDIDKIEALQPLIDSFGAELFRAVMIEKLIDKFNAIQELARLVEHLIDASGRQVIIQTSGQSIGTETL